MMKYRSALAGLVLTSLAAGVGADTAPFEGKVLSDVDSTPIHRAQVVLYNLDRPEERVSTTTDEGGSFSLSLEDLARPRSFGLGQNHPNPFNPSTLIPFRTSHAGHVRLDVFNLLGQRVVTLIDETRPAGRHRVRWDGTDAAGRGVGAGVYLYRLSTGRWQQTRRLVLVDGPAGHPGPGSGPALTGESPRYGVEISGQEIVSASLTWTPGMGALVAEVEGVRGAYPLDIQGFETEDNPLAGVSLESIAQVVSTF